MAEQKYIIGDASAYRQLARMTRAPGNAAQAPKTVRLSSGELFARVDCDLVGRYDRSGAVSEQQVFALKHNISRDRATLEVQRFVKAVRVQGREFVKTSGTGYLQWGEASEVPQGRAIQALCASQLRAAGIQDDGPRGSGKVFEAPDLMGLEIRDSPGMAASLATSFPYALLADFIMRIIVRPANGNDAEVAEFRYQSYFELAADPYPQGMRAAAFVPPLSGYSDYQRFDNITQRYQADQQRNAQPGAVRRQARAAPATTDDVGQVIKKKNFNDMI
ncbi:MAG: hypothetical protein ACLPTF_01440 [Steroidobacteraceae bacterium]